MSFHREVFPGNRLHWYWWPKAKKHSNTCIWNTQCKWQKTCRIKDNKTIKPWRYGSCLLQHQARKCSRAYTHNPEPTQGTMLISCTRILQSCCKMEPH